MRNSKNFRDLLVSTLLNKMLIRLKLDYTSIIWSPYYFTHINGLERTQRRFLKYLAFRENLLHPNFGFTNNILFERFFIESLEHRRRSSELTFPFILLRNSFNFWKCLLFLVCVPETSTRASQLFYLKSSKTNIYKYSLLKVQKVILKYPLYLNLSLNFDQNILAIYDMHSGFFYILRKLNNYSKTYFCF